MVLRKIAVENNRLDALIKSNQNGAFYGVIGGVVLLAIGLNGFKK